MNLGDILSPQQIVPELKATNRWEAIDELIGVLVSSGRISVENRDAVTSVVKKREQSMSTGIGFGIGIPHASTDLITEVVAAFGRSKAGVNFDALDNQPVHLVTLLAGIAKVLRKEEFLKSLEDAPDSAAIMGIIRHYSALR
jgi:mannitol/fructose-specific phosphotransferase system IIA component (Ntr-type)